MAPNCPEEVDVFTIPHSRMKELVHRYLDLLTGTNFSDVDHMTLLLENLVNAFQEFRAHEQIENKYIMKKLKQKLQTLSIRSTAVCNCHSDNKLAEMLVLLQDGYRCRDKGEVDRQNYGIKLRTALEDFTQKFLPHMEEEEEVFQPMLMKYFSFDELRHLKYKVLRKHQQTINDELAENEEFVSSSSDEDEKSVKVEVREVAGINRLPDEIMMLVFSHLNPRDLCRSAQVCKRWNDLAMDGENWQVLRPVQWCKGAWSFTDKMNFEAEEADVAQVDDEYYPVDIKCDEDADVDETEEILEELSPEATQIQKEARMLTEMIKYLLPKVGKYVRECHMGYSKGLTNGVLYRIFSSCPNLEILDLTQTRVSDIGFKSLGKNKSGRRLKYVNLSGCVNITDVTLQKLSSALGHIPCHTQNDTNHWELSQSVLEGPHWCSCKNDTTNTKQQLRAGRGPGLDFISVENTLRQACDALQRNMMTMQIMDLLEDNIMFPSFLSGMMGNQRQIWMKWTKTGEVNPVTQNTIAYYSERTPYMFHTNPVYQQLSDTERTCSSNERNSGIGNLCDNNVNCDRDVPITRGLEYLSLSGCYQITDSGISALSENGGLPLLQYLDLSGCMNITAVGLSSLVWACPELDHAQLFYCDNLMDDPFADTASGCQNLEMTSRKCCRTGY